ncbi:uncharacterized protein UTRI_06217 [Ustilago trichophora]|uniref:Uncharacterized protein n=1 Tax=Ustilago trichophora TaxID=86804 RepID=A0A5C3EFK1_9BASI|nr:uncharacterized protein UTRI_06217 [Ustilago trichophora]
MFRAVQTQQEVTILKKQCPLGRMRLIHLSSLFFSALSIKATGPSSTGGSPAMKPIRQPMGQHAVLALPYKPPTIQDLNLAPMVEDGMVSMSSKSIDKAQLRRLWQVTIGKVPWLEAIEIVNFHEPTLTHIRKELLDQMLRFQDTQIFISVSEAKHEGSTVGKIVAFPMRPSRKLRSIWPQVELQEPLWALVEIYPFQSTSEMHLLGLGRTRPRELKQVWTSLRPIGENLRKLIHHVPANIL